MHRRMSSKLGWFSYRILSCKEVKHIPKGTTFTFVELGVSASVARNVRKFFILYVKYLAKNTTCCSYFSFVVGYVTAFWAAES
jgi:hypothetical protein